MPDKEELEVMLDEYGERNLAEFPDQEAWEALKAEVLSLHEGGDDGEDR